MPGVRFLPGPGGSRWVQAGPGGSRRVQAGPGGSRRVQEGPGSVPFNELPPLGGLPQQVPEVVGVLLRLAVGRERPGEGPPVGAGRGTNVNPPLSRRPDETGSDLSRRG